MFTVLFDSVNANLHLTPHHLPRYPSTWNSNRLHNLKFFSFNLVFHTPSYYFSTFFMLGEHIPTNPLSINKASGVTFGHATSVSRPCCRLSLSCRPSCRFRWPPSYLVLKLDHIIIRGVSIYFSKSVWDDKVLLLIVLEIATTYSALTAGNVHCRLWRMRTADYGG